MNNSIKSTARYLFIIMAGAAVILSSGIDVLTVATDGGDSLYRAGTPYGSGFSTEYTHSVQKTPVLDRYIIMDGHIWQWEERVQSHNAGLPTEAPPRGKFIVAPPWFIIRGGRTAWKSFIYRVGGEDLGKNIWFLPGVGKVIAYMEYPGKRVRFALNRKRPFFEGKNYYVR